MKAQRGNKMKWIKACTLGAVCIIAVLGIWGLALADSAEVLPKGVSRVKLKGSYYNDVTERFDPDGNEESVATFFNDTLGSNVFPVLGLFEQSNGGPLPDGTANIGDSIVDFNYEFRDLILDYRYGISDKVTIGIYVPYYWNKTKLTEARVDTSNATLGIDPSTGLPAIPIADGGTGIVDDAIATPFVLGLIESPPYLFEPFESWSGSGLADIEAAVRYQYLKNDAWRLAFTGGIRFPTGAVDDPNNLLDVGFGKGAYALLFRLNNDLIAVKNFTVNATLKYDLYLPDEQTLRVLEAVDRPLATIANMEQVDRNLGDIFEIELSGDWGFTSMFSLYGTYKYGSRQKDRVSGNRGLNYDSLEDLTDWSYHSALAGISFSTVSKYLDEKASIPFSIEFDYENVFAGTNLFLKQQVYSLALYAYF